MIRPRPVPHPVRAERVDQCARGVLVDLVTEQDARGGHVDPGVQEVLTGVPQPTTGMQCRKASCSNPVSLTSRSPGNPSAMTIASYSMERVVSNVRSTTC